MITTISKLSGHAGMEVTLNGWLYNLRTSKKARFLLIRDGTGIVQCTAFINDVPEGLFAACGELTQESSLSVTGTVRADDRAPGGHEISITGLQVHQVAIDYPISPKEHGTDFLMDHRHLWLRSKRQHAILRIRAEIINAVRDFFNSRDFTVIDAPIFTPAACEGTTTLFETAYFDEKAYLTQSGQLYMEAAAMAFGKVYCFGPTFRAEKSSTRRHLTEFWMVEPEVVYMDLAGDMQLAEDFLCSIVHRVLDKRKEELKVLERNIDALEKIQAPFPRLHYNEAVDILRKNGAEFEWGNDFGGGDETIISQAFDRPVMVHRYPAQIKAFYMKNDPEDTKHALCVDVLAPEGYGEIIGGGQREDNHDILVEKIKAHNLPIEAFQWYLDIRKYGSVPHAGFGLGIERTVAWLCGLQHVRETMPFPRLMNRLTP
jgi:asparaginyl-tRNA synthetase